MRITQKDIDVLVYRLNWTLGTPETSYNVDSYHKATSNVGNIYAERAYGGMKLVQIVNEHGGVRELTFRRTTKRETYELLQSMITGAELATGRK